jgi:hypothetical protein
MPIGSIKTVERAFPTVGLTDQAVNARTIARVMPNKMRMEGLLGFR